MIVKINWSNQYLQEEMSWRFSKALYYNIWKIQCGFPPGNYFFIISFIWNILYMVNYYSKIKKIPQSWKSSKQCTWSHTDTKTYSKSHFHSVKAAWTLGLPIHWWGCWHFDWNQINYILHGCQIEVLVPKSSNYTCCH